MEEIPAVITITLNPALDLASSTAQVVAGPKLRCAPPRLDPGGGGINVSRVVERMGGETAAFVALGGGTGMRFLKVLRREGITTRVIPIEDETRQSLGVIDEQTGAQYRFVLPGPVLTADECQSVIDAILEEALSGDYVVLSGSLPQGVPPDFTRALARALAGQGTRLVVDTSGPALLDVVRTPFSPEARPAVLRFDHLEAEEAAGHALPTPADTARFAASLVQRGVAETVVVGRQAEGNILADVCGVWMAHAARVEVVSTTGAGDSFVGALVTALALGIAPPEALRWGTAAACAAVTTPATDLCDPDHVEELREHCTLSAVDYARL